MYFTAMSAVTLHNLANNIEEATRFGSFDDIHLTTSDVSNWTLAKDEQTLIKTFPLCNGSHQSPINIESGAIKENLGLRLGLTAYDKPISGFLVNQFPTFRLVPYSLELPKPSAIISNSIARSFNPYADSYFVLNYIQFHWSAAAISMSTNANGQDMGEPAAGHTLDGHGSPVEIHFVHVNTAYTNLDEAHSRPDGLMILAVMAVPSTHESYVFDRLLDSLTNVTRPQSQVAFDEDSTWRSLLPEDTSRFYRYHGSLVLPGCHESVQWVVFEDKLRLGARQLKRLRRFKFLGNHLATGDRIDWSAQRRSTRPVNNRTIERSFSSSSSSSSLLLSRRRSEGSAGVGRRKLT